ncbi:MAG TPA: putative toxin-antitoxin system toxin component, PIN family [Saprospiraceae bacterium]|nr:putative toxin-antitoxin system toxin component, PIN family [Saprospiraceae bacterium]
MPRNRKLRIILDTNIWISFLISNRQNNFDLLLKQSKAEILFSTELLNEIKDTIEKPKLKKYFSSNSMEEMLNAFEVYIVLVSVSTTVSICRDPKDNFLLSLALDGKADYLLTGDKDLLSMKTYKKTKIISITSFVNNLKSIL